MIIIGDFSGIQDYVFDIAHHGGGQAKRLRARSFFIQVLTECAALRVRQAVGWTAEHLLFCSAGKFMFARPDPSEGTARLLRGEEDFIGKWLLRETAGQLRFSLVWSEEDGSELAQYERAMQALQRSKLRPWAGVAATTGGWQPRELVLPPLDTPCDICGHRAGVFTETDIDDRTGEPGETLVCQRCRTDKLVGGLLPRTEWLVLSGTSQGADFEAAGLSVSLREGGAPTNEGLLALANLTDAARFPPGLAADKKIERPLARHIPTDNNRRPLEFGEIAEHARGDHLLAVLKMDGDSLGQAFALTLKQTGELRQLGQFSHELDSFMAQTLGTELRKQEWQHIYTIFAGGDDLIAVGPWDVVLDYAGHVQKLFQVQFGSRRLTISGGVSLMKPRRPIKGAVEVAAALLDLAKTRAAPGQESAKDQIAGLGQIWKWAEHEGIVASGKRLAHFVESRVAQRGWLHTVLELANLRQQERQPRNGSGDETGAGDHPRRRTGPARVRFDDPHQATARLAYHVARNYPSANDRDPQKAAFRQWADKLIADFDDCTEMGTRYLPAIARYALIATRKVEKED